MIDPIGAARLIRKVWSNPNDLARELYELVQSKDARKVQSPVEIAVPKGQVGLRLVRSADRPSTAGPAPRPSQAQPYPDRGGSPMPPQPRVASRTRQGNSNAEPQVARREPPQAPGSNLDLAQRPTRESPARTTAEPAQPPRRPQETANRPAPILVASNTPEIPRRPRQPDLPPAQFTPVGDLPSYARAYQSPIFESLEEVRFGGIHPVQFDNPPVLLNRDTGIYEPFEIASGLTRIPRENRYRIWYGEVDTANGMNKLNRPIYKVKIYAWPDGELEDTVDVTMWGLDPLVTLTKGERLWPVWQASDGNHYAVPAIRERLAKTTSVVQPRAGNTPGSGTAQVYTFVNGQFQGNPGGSLTVYLFTGKPSSSAGTIPSGTWAIIREMYGVWWIVAQDCSGAA